MLVIETRDKRVSGGRRIKKSDATVRGNKEHGDRIWVSGRLQGPERQKEEGGPHCRREYKV